MPGHPDLRVPAKRSQLQHVAEIMRNHHRSMREQDRIIAGALRRGGLVELLGRTGAYRVARQFSHAASLNAELAHAYMRAYELYSDIYAKRQHSTHSFDPDS